MYEQDPYFDLQGLSENYYNEDSLDTVYSVEAAIYKVILRPYQLKQIVDYVVSKGIHGNPNSFHLLINLCKERRDYEEALKLCRFALSRIDSLILYTDIIEIGMHFENPIRYCGTHLGRVLRSDRTHWDLRLFWAVYTCFYMLVANKLIGGIDVEYYDNAKEAAIGMQKSFYGREDGYLAEARLLILVGRRDEARLRLEDLIFNPYDPKKDSSRDLRCPKCCRLWMTEFKDYSGDQQKVYQVVAKGFLESEDKEDIAFFNHQKDFLIQQLIRHGQGDEDDSMSSRNERRYSIDKYNNPNYFEKGRQQNG